MEKNKPQITVEEIAEIMNNPTTAAMLTHDNKPNNLHQKIYGNDVSMYCSSCRVAWPNNASFCGYCGTKLKEYKKE